MFNTDDILARLQKGDTMDVIAAEMANALNTAKTAYDEAEAKRIAEAEVENQKKRAIVQRIVDAFADYADLVGKKEIADKLDDSDLDGLAKAIDAMIELTEMTEKLKVLEYTNPFTTSFPVGKKKMPKPVKENVKPTPDDIISEFLKTL